MLYHCGFCCRGHAAMGSQGRSGLASRPGRRRRMLLAGLILAGVQAMAETPPTLVVTIHPLLLMAADIAGGVDQGVQLERLIPPHRSPHDYQLPPSRRLVLARADAVVWMGPRLESGLARLLQRLGERGQTLAADVDPHSEADAHDWLDPLAAAAMARRLGALLAQLDERQGDAYRQRAEELALALERSHEAWQYRLQAMQGIRYWVSHDAYGQFEQRYGRGHQARVALSPERPPGAGTARAAAAGVAPCGGRTATGRGAGPGSGAEPRGLAVPPAGHARDPLLGQPRCLRPVRAALRAESSGHGGAQPRAAPGCQSCAGPAEAASCRRGGLRLHRALVSPSRADSPAVCAPDPTGRAGSAGGGPPGRRFYLSGVLGRLCRALCELCRDSSSDRGRWIERPERPGRMLRAAGRTRPVAPRGRQCGHGVPDTAWISSYIASIRSFSIRSSSCWSS